MSAPSESDYLKISVINSGNVWKAKFSSCTKINKLIGSSLHHFHNPSVHSTLKSLKHKMVLVRNRHVLSEDKSLAEEELKDNDEVLLVECRTSPKQTPPDLRGPTASDILEATKHLGTQNVEKLGHKSMETEDDLDYHERFNKDSSSIFITLIETAACLLAYAPNGMEVFQQIKKEMTSKREPAFHSPHVKQLTDMGFPQEMVVKALSIKKMNVSEAMEWLLEENSAPKEIDHQEEPSTSHPAQTLTVLESFQDLLQSTLRKRQETFKLNMETVEQLKQMGYEEKDIEIALRQTNNSLKAALIWLSDKSHGGTVKNYRSLDPNGAMFKALMGSDHVQLYLKKPKFIFALLSILEDPECLNLWLKDHDISFILNHLITMHNTESSGGRRIN